MIYVGFLLIFAFASFFDISRNSAPLKSITLLILFFITVFFIGLRYYTGSDWAGYIRYFNTVSWNNDIYEFGYKVLNLVVKYTVNNYFFVQFLASFFFIFSVFRFYCKYNTQYLFLSIFLALTLYFSELFMSQIRQSLAIGILLFATGFLLDKKWIKYCICVFTASLFHKTAVFAFVFFLLLIDVPKFVRVSLIVLGWVLVQFPDLITNMLLFVSRFLPSGLEKMVVSYLFNDIFGDRAGLNSGIYWFSRQILVLIIVILYQPRHKWDIFVLNSLVMYALLEDIRLVYYILERVGAYVGFYAVIGFTRLFKIRIVREYRGIFFCVLCLCIIYFTIPFYILRTDRGVSELTGRDKQYQYLPYYNVFFHPEGFYRKDWNE